LLYFYIQTPESESQGTLELLDRLESTRMTSHVDLAVFISLFHVVHFF